MRKALRFKECELWRLHCADLIDGVEEDIVGSINHFLSQPPGLAQFRLLQTGFPAYS